jgi:hypothetical protein
MLDKKAAIEHMRNLSWLKKEAISIQAAQRPGAPLQPVANISASAVPSNSGLHQASLSDASTRANYTPVTLPQAKIGRNVARKNTRPVGDKQVARAFPDQTGAGGNRRPSGVSGITKNQVNAYGTAPMPQQGKLVLSSITEERAKLLLAWRREHGMEKEAWIPTILGGARALLGAGVRGTTARFAPKLYQTAAKIRGGVKGLGTPGGWRGGWNAATRRVGNAARLEGGGLRRFEQLRRQKDLWTPLKQSVTGTSKGVARTMSSPQAAAAGAVRGGKALASSLGKGAWSGAKWWGGGQLAGYAMDPESNWDDPERLELANSMGLLRAGTRSLPFGAYMTAGDLGMHDGPSFSKSVGGLTNAAGDLWEGQNSEGIVSQSQKHTKKQRTNKQKALKDDIMKNDAHARQEQKRRKASETSASHTAQNKVLNAAKTGPQGGI